MENQSILPENRSYLGSLDFDISRCVLLSALSAVAAIVIGVSVAVIDYHVISLALLFSALAGIAIGFFISQALVVAKANNLWAVRVAGLTQWDVPPLIAILSAQ